MVNIRTSRLFGYVRPHWFILSLSLVSMIGVTALDLAIPWTLGVLLVDRVIVAKNIDLLPWIIALLASIIFGGGLITILKGYVVGLTTQRLIHNLRQDLYTHIQFAPITYHERVHSGELLARLSADTENLKDLIRTTLDRTMTDTITVSATAILLLSLSPYLTLFILPTMVMMIIAVRLFRKRIRAATAETRAAISKMLSMSKESIAGIRVVKAFAREKFEVEQFRKSSMKITKASMAIEMLTAGYSASVDAVVVIGVILVVAFATPQTIAGQLTLGVLFTYLTLLNKLYKPTRELANASAQIQQMIVSVGRIFEVMEIEPEAGGQSKTPHLTGAIKFDHVSFTYTNGGFDLNEFDLEIRAGEKIALVGPSGTGKTTIVSLILGFYRPNRGRIYIDGVPLDELDLQSYRESVGVIFQDPFLFSGTIRENISYGKMGATEAEIMDVAKVANADSFIDKLPGRYDYDIGEGGVRLSAGQRQRIAIARAMIKNPSLLILDEATSNVDAESDFLIREAIARVMEGRTTIIIAHRFSNVVEADKIVVMEGGRVQETGTHQSLIGSKGIYSRLYAAQLGDSRK